MEGPDETEKAIAEVVADKALDLSSDHPPEHILRGLAIGYPVIFQYQPGDLDTDLWRAMNAMARMGYLVRTAETIMLDERAMEGSDRVSEMVAPLVTQADEDTPLVEVLADCASHFARAEAFLEPPDGSLLMTVAGQSHIGQIECAHNSSKPSSDPSRGVTSSSRTPYADDREANILNGDEVLQCWLFGFFFRVSEECVLRASGEAVKS